MWSIVAHWLVNSNSISTSTNSLYSILSICCLFWPFFVFVALFFYRLTLTYFIYTISTPNWKLNAPNYRNIFSSISLFCFPPAWQTHKKNGFDARKINYTQLWPIIYCTWWFFHGVSRLPYQIPGAYPLINSLASVIFNLKFFNWWMNFIQIGRNSFPQSRKLMAKGIQKKNCISWSGKYAQLRCERCKWNIYEWHEISHFLHWKLELEPRWHIFTVARIFDGAGTKQQQKKKWKYLMKYEWLKGLFKSSTDLIKRWHRLSPFENFSL